MQAHTEYNWNFQRENFKNKLISSLSSMETPGEFSNKIKAAITVAKDLSCGYSENM